MINENKISIIVPAYNIEKYIVRCLTSIKEQTYSNFECIIVDDGSTDNTGFLCDQFVKHDKRFTVIHKKNEGLSCARNIALGVSEGDYISFIDGDDFILPNFYEKMLDLMLNNNADISKCDYFKGFIDKKNHSEINVFGGKEFTEEILEDRIGSQLWQYLFKKELWNDILSPQGRYAQDMMILHEVTNRAKTIVSTNEKLYFYYIDRNDSTSNSTSKKIKGAFDRAVAFKIRYDFCCVNGYPNCKLELIKKVIDFYNNALSLKKVDDREYLQDQNELSYFLKCNQNIWKKLGFKYCVLGYSLTYFPNLYCKLKGKRI